MPCEIYQLPNDSIAAFAMANIGVQDGGSGGGAVDPPILADIRHLFRFRAKDNTFV